MKRALAILIAVALTVVMIVELGAETIATRVVAARVADEIPYDSMQVTAIGRPASLDLLFGRVRDIEMVARGVIINDVRLDEVTIDADEVALGWSPAVDQTVAFAAQVTVTEDDLTAALRARLSLAEGLVLELEDRAVALGVEAVPLRIRAGIVPRDGHLWLVPNELPGWYLALGLPTEINVFTLPAGVHVEQVTLTDGEAHVDVRVSATPDAVGSGAIDALLRDQ